MFRFLFDLARRSLARIPGSVIGGGVLLLIALLARATWKANRAERDLLGARRAVDSIQVVHDTTVRGLLRVQGDTVAYWQRRSLQTAQRADALDQALQLARKAKVTGTIVLHRVDTVLVTPASDSGGERVARLVLAQPPIHVTARVAIPASDSAHWDVQAWLDTLHWSLRLGCGGKPPFRSATTTFTLTGNVSATLDSVTQDPGVCNLPATRHHPWWVVGALVTGGLAGGLIR